VDLNFCSDVVFLALTVWREARGTPVSCRIAVAFSILNRVDRPSWWGNSITSVVFKKWQYSSLTDPRDPQLAKWPLLADPSWAECLQVAFDVINGTLKTSLPGSDSYHDVSIPAPKWATSETFVGQIGRIRFYDLDHDVEHVVIFGAPVT
jgi:spore germination cell wall hydrolase CwlJ-like protein